MLKKVLRLSPEFKNKEAIILRDYLALERTRLANETTLMSYIKASLYLFLSGIAFKQLEGFEEIKWMGNVALVLSIAFVIIGVFRFFLLRSRLAKYYQFEDKTTEKT